MKSEYDMKDEPIFFFGRSGIYNVTADGEPGERIDIPELPSRYDKPTFAGPHEPEDEPKFQSDLERVRQFFLDHPNRWYSKEEIRVGCGMPVGKDVTPRIRDLRKERYGGLEIRQQKVSRQYRYCLIR